MFLVIWNIFKKPARIIPAIIVGFLFYSLVVLLPHIETLKAFLRSPDWILTVKLAWGILVGNVHIVGLVPSIFFLLLCVALSVSLALTLELISLRSRLQRSNISVKKINLGGSGHATVLAFLGYGCVACGTALSATVFHTLGLSVIAGWLPLQGLEFSILGICLVFFSWHGLTKQISAIHEIMD